MKIFFLALLLFANGHVLRAEASSPLLGHWRFTEFIYKGKSHPPLSPGLILEFEFRSNGDDILAWHWEGDEGFCRRFGRYQFDGKVLKDVVVRTDPANRIDCGRDPDMQTGHHSETPLSFVNGRLHMHLNLGDEPLIYIWEKTSDSGDSGRDDQ
jgi:hypothetical protein